MACQDVELCEKIDTLILSTDNNTQTLSAIQLDFIGWQGDFTNTYFPEIQMISFVLQFALIVTVFILFLVWIYKLIKKFEF